VIQHETKDGTLLVLDVPAEYPQHVIHALNANKQMVLKVAKAMGTPTDIELFLDNPSRPVLLLRFEDGVEVRIPVQVYSEGVSH
jgi:hypothetical protein